MSAEKRQKSSKVKSYLDRVIDKYSASPECDPEFVNYTIRPAKDEGPHYKATPQATAS